MNALEWKREDPVMEERRKIGRRSGNGGKKRKKWNLSLRASYHKYPLQPTQHPAILEAESEAEVRMRNGSRLRPGCEAAPIPHPVPANPVPANPIPEAAPIGTSRLIPFRRLFTDTQVWTGSSSSAAAAGHNPEDLTPSHIRSDLDALHRRVQHIEEEDVRADNKRLKMMLDCSENRTRDAWRENDRATWHYHHLRRWSIMVENLLPPRLRYQEPPYALPETLLAPATHNDPRDPYVAARDAATAPATDTDDAPTQKETSPSEPQGSPPRDS
ncbi:hypothetical protein Tco_1180806 [Tanacetum coccineum]